MRTSAWFTIVIALATLDCGGKANANEQEETASSPLSECEADSQCAGDRCICGYCTIPCSSNDDCQEWPGSSCRSGSAIGCSREGSLCLPTDAEGPPSADPSGGGAGASAIEPEPGVLPETDDDLPDEPGTDPEPTAASPDLADCRDLVTGEGSLGSGSALVDRYVAEVEHVAQRTEALSADAATVFTELATMVGASTATATDVVGAYPDWVTGVAGASPTLLMWPAHCPISTANLDAFTQACDPDLAPSDESLLCDGLCLPDSGTTCREGTLECQVPSPDPCGGTCEGACSTILGPGGVCDGSCEGTCHVTTADECAEGETTCRSESGSPISCMGACEGELEPRETIEGCSETARAAAWLSLSCTATAPVLFSADLDAGVSSAPAELTEFLTTTARVLALHEEAMLTLQAAALLNAALPAVEAATATTAEGGAGATSECVPVLLTAAAGTLGQAGADIDRVMTDTSTFITGIQ